MILRPCLHCRIRAGCERREAMRARLAGSGVTSASFRCPDRLLGLGPGTRVNATIHGADEDEYGDAKAAVIPGTILGQSRKAPGKLVLWLDEGVGEAGRQAVKVWPDALVPTGETVPLCDGGLVSTGNDPHDFDMPGQCGRPFDAPPDTGCGSPERHGKAAAA